MWVVVNITVTIRQVSKVAFLTSDISLEVVKGHGKNHPNHDIPLWGSISYSLFLYPVSPFARKIRLFPMQGFYSQLVMRFKVVPLLQWWIQGRGLGHPLFLDQTEARRVGNFFSETASPPHPPLICHCVTCSKMSRVSLRGLILQLTEKFYQ